MGTMEKITEALETHGSKRYGQSWNCPGPMHSNGDRKPSLTVAQAKGSDKILLHCFTGCEFEDIMSALALKPSDAFGEAQEKARYTYFTADGKSTFEKIRLDGKIFTMRPTLNGAGAQIYRWPEVKDAIARREQVYLVNGERAADRLWEKEGCAATCGFAGEGHWKPEYGDYLKSAHVIMVVDRDETGSKHAADVRKDLKHKAASLRFVQSKTSIEHDDVVDHLDAGYSLEELIPYFPQNEISKKYRPVDWREAFANQPGEVQWLFPPMIEVGTLNVLFGLPGVGKSLMVLQMILETLRDGKTVLVLDLENRVLEVVERLKKFGVNSPSSLENLAWFSFPQMPPLDTPDGGEHVIALADAYKPDLVVMDTATRLVEGDENSASTWLQMYRNTLAPLKQRGIAVLRLDHQGKDGSRGQRGSSAKDGDVDTIWRLKFQDGGFLALEREKSRSGHGEDWILVRRQQEPLWHVFEELDHLPVTPRMKEWADRFDSWGIPRDAGRPTLKAAIEERWGQDPDRVGVSTTILSLVVKYRKGLDSQPPAA